MCCSRCPPWCNPSIYLVLGIALQVLACDPIGKSKQKTLCIIDDQIKIVSIPCNPYLCMLTSLSCVLMLLSISIISNICLKRGIKLYLNANVFWQISIHRSNIFSTVWLGSQLSYFTQYRFTLKHLLSHLWLHLKENGSKFLVWRFIIVCPGILFNLSRHWEEQRAGSSAGIWCVMTGWQSLIKSSIISMCSNGGNIKWTVKSYRTKPKCFTI